jgi:hypothetical protein
MSLRFRSAAATIARCIGAVTKPHGGRILAWTRQLQPGPYGWKAIRCEWVRSSRLRTKERVRAATAPWIGTIGVLGRGRIPAPAKPHGNEALRSSHRSPIRWPNSSATHRTGHLDSHHCRRLFPRNASHCATRGTTRAPFIGIDDVGVTGFYPWPIFVHCSRPVLVPASEGIDCRPHGVGLCRQQCRGNIRARR